MAKKDTAKKKPLRKSALLQAVTDTVGDGLSRRQVTQVIETLVSVGHTELRKNGVFTLHPVSPSSSWSRSRLDLRARGSIPSLRRSRSSRRSPPARVCAPGP